MGIENLTVITCDGCKEKINSDASYIYLQSANYVQSAPYFNGTIVVCNNNCLKTFANSLS